MNERTSDRETFEGTVESVHYLQWWTRDNHFADGAEWIFGDSVLVIHRLGDTLWPGDDVVIEQYRDPEHGYLRERYHFEAGGRVEGEPGQAGFVPVEELADV